MQVATVDVGGWDTHTDEANQLDRQLSSAAKSLAAFLTDLGPVRRKRVTVVVMTEFGRRVQMNANGGTDHGHGSVMWLLGGGLAGASVYGKWTPLTGSVLDSGDVPALNGAFDVLGELAQKRLGVGAAEHPVPGPDVRPAGTGQGRLRHGRCLGCGARHAVAEGIAGLRLAAVRLGGDQRPAQGRPGAPAVGRNSAVRSAAVLGPAVRNSSHCTRATPPTMNAPPTIWTGRATGRAAARRTAPRTAPRSSRGRRRASRRARGRR